MTTSVASSGTVLRVVALLRAVAFAEQGATVAQLAAEVGLPRPTVHRLLGLLAEDGIVTLDAKSRLYQPGPEFLRLSARVANRFPLVDLAMPIMRDVVAETGEACLLGIYLPGSEQMMFGAQVASTHPLGYRIELMVPVPVAWGASGKAILALLPEATIGEILRQTGPSPVTGRELSIPETARELDEIRARGFAYSKGEKIPGSRGIAGPVRGADGWARASLCLTIPELRFDDSTVNRLGALIVRRSNELSALLGA